MVLNPNSGVLTRLPTFSPKHPKDQAIRRVLKLAAREGIQARDLAKYLAEPPAEQILPLTIFRNRRLSPLETTVKYLKETGMKNREISTHLSRSDQTVWYTYRNANRKHPSLLTVEEGPGIPLQELQREDLSFLETLVVWLQKQGLRYRDIANILGRNERTIWTLAMRARRKTGGAP